MIWLALPLLAVCALLPLLLLLRAPGPPRGRRDAELTLYRAQLAELGRDRAEGRLLPAEHQTALLEVQRRLLAAGEAAEPPPRPGRRGPLVLTLILTPLAATLLYLVGGAPGLPAAPLQARLSRAEAEARDTAVLVQRLRAHLAQLPPGSDQMRQGYRLLGNVEAARRNMTAAAEAWRTALAIRFEPDLALETAEAITEAAGHLTPEGKSLFQQALNAAPKDAPWRGMAERRLAEDGKPGEPGGNGFAAPAGTATTPLRTTR